MTSRVKYQYGMMNVTKYKCYDCGKPATKSLDGRFDEWDLFHKIYFCDECYNKKLVKMYESCPMKFDDEVCKHQNCYKLCPKRVLHE